MAILLSLFWWGSQENELVSLIDHSCSVGAEYTAKAVRLNNRIAVVTAGHEDVPCEVHVFERSPITGRYKKSADFPLLDGEEQMLPIHSVFSLYLLTVSPDHVIEIKTIDLFRANYIATGLAWLFIFDTVRSFFKYKKQATVKGETLY